MKTVERSTGLKGELMSKFKQKCCYETSDFEVKEKCKGELFIVQSQRSLSIEATLVYCRLHLWALGQDIHRVLEKDYKG